MYRTAFLPALVALFVAAFALADRPRPATSSLPTDAFSGDRALGTGEPPEPQSLRGMAAAFPDRRAGSAGDTRLADFVASVLAAPDESGRPGFAVRRIVSPGRTADGRGELTTVVGTRPGLSSRRIVVVAHRDALTSPALADLSGTATLLELARVFKTRDVRKTLELVSTSGSTTGFAGAAAWAREEAGGPVDAVIVLGDMGGTQIRKPWVVGWPAAAQPSPLALERTVQAAVRRETGSDAGGPHAVGRWVRRAVPATLSEQGVIAAEGLPAVLISETGEQSPAPDDPVSSSRLQAFGRAALRAVSGIDAAGPNDGPAFASSPSGIVTLRNVLPDWAVRLVVGTALLPALLAALDAYFRARRRRTAVGPWVLWLAVAALGPFAAWLWLRCLGAAGILATPDGPVAPAAFPLDTPAIVALVSAAIAGALAWWMARLLARSRVGRAEVEAPRERRREGGSPVDGLAVAAGLLVCALAAVAWVLNPYAAALLVPAAHLWLFAAAGWRPRTGLVALAVGLVPIVLVPVYYLFALGLGPGELAWGAALGAAAGAGLWSTLLVSGMFAAVAGVLRVLRARHRLGGEHGAGEVPIRTRGPLGYAGPGSLGGTESALRR